MDSVQLSKSTAIIYLNSIQLTVFIIKKHCVSCKMLYIRQNSCFKEKWQKQQVPPKCQYPSNKLYESYPRRHYEGHALAQAVNHWPLCREPGWSQASPCGMCDEWSVFLPQYHSTSAPNSYFIHLRPIPHNRSNWQCFPPSFLTIILRAFC